MHLKNFKFYLISAVRKKNIRHDQGHQRASASTGSINIIQNKNITVYEVESQKTVNAKLWKRNIGFQK